MRHLRSLILLAFIHILTLNGYLFPQDTISPKYFPLKTGNSWTYSWTRNYPSPLHGRYKVNITQSLFMNNHLYYCMHYFEELLFGGEYFEYVRIDSINGRYLKFSSSGGCYWLQNDVMYDSLAMKYSDVSKGEFEGTFCLGPLYCYDVLGRVIATPVNEKLSPGTYEVDFDATNYPSGVYYYSLSSGNYFESKKMVLIK